MNGEDRLLEIFRALDNRGRSHVLAIAEAELNYASERPCTPRSGVLTESMDNSEGETK